MSEHSQPVLVSINEAARLISLSRVSVYSLINAGKLRAKKQGHRTLIPIAEIRRYAEELPDMIPS